MSCDAPIIVALPPRRIGTSESKADAALMEVTVVGCWIHTLTNEASLVSMLLCFIGLPPAESSEFWLDACTGVHCLRIRNTELGVDFTLIVEVHA